MGSVVSVEEQSEDVARIVLNRPEKLNALNDELKIGISEAIRDSNGSYEVLIVEGAGDSFAAGADLDEARDRTDGDEEYSPELSQEMTRAVMEFEGVVIGKLHGWVIGAGFEWSLSFDLRYAETGTTFRMPESQLGLSVSNASTLLLQFTIGPSKARELVYTSTDLDAREAERLDLVLGVYEEDELEAEVVSVAEDIAENASPEALWANKRGLNDALPVEEALQRESLLGELLNEKTTDIDWE